MTIEDMRNEPAWKAASQVGATLYLSCCLFTGDHGDKDYGKIGETISECIKHMKNEVGEDCVIASLIALLHGYATVQNVISDTQYTESENTVCGIEV